MRFDIWQTDRERAEVLPCGLKVLRGVSVASGKSSAKIWTPKATKPFANYVFPDEARREAFIAEQVENYLSGQRKRAKRKLERAGRLEGVKLQEVNVGDIFDYSWGYDQTNVEFFEVVERRGRQVIIREVAHRSEAAGQDERVSPNKGRYLDKPPQTKLVQWTNDGKAFLAMPFGWCDLWDGNPQYQTGLFNGH